MAIAGFVLLSLVVPLDWSKRKKREQLLGIQRPMRPLEIRNFRAEKTDSRSNGGGYYAPLDMSIEAG